MKSLCIIIFLLQYVFCRNLERDLGTDPILQLNKLNKLSRKLQESGVSIALSVEPVKINKDDITLLVYTQAKPDKTEIPLTDASKIASVSQFNPELKTVFYVHGWQDGAETKSCPIIRDALLQSANVNVIIVNWDECSSNIDYLISQGCVPDVGKYVGQFVETMAQAYSYSLSDITVIGHSLGAHVAGHIGKHTNGALGSIIGLDPAGPLYFKDIRSARLTEDDAQYVQGIHTNALLFGVNFNVGHADFWPNGGYSQNGCGIDEKCSHLNAYKYYAESLINDQFYSRKCDSYNNYKNGKCNQNSKALMGGLNVDTSVVGTYYLNTNAQSPYGEGDV